MKTRIVELLVLSTFPLSSVASSWFESGWESAWFRTQSGYEVRLEADERNLLRLAEVKLAGELIPIPPAAYCNIEHPAISGGRLHESAGGYAMLELTSRIFERGKAIGSIRWAFNFRHGKFVGLSRDDVPQSLDSLSPCGEA